MARSFFFFYCDNMKLRQILENIGLYRRTTPDFSLMSRLITEGLTDSSCAYFTVSKVGIA